MRWKFVISVIVMFVMLFLLGWGVHGTWLAGDYAKLPNLTRPMPEVWNRFPLMLLAQLLTAVGFTWIYLKGKEAKPWLTQGIGRGAGDHPGQPCALCRHAVPARAGAQAGELRRRHHHPHGHRARLDQPLTLAGMNNG
jgi:hypothetical protein